MDKVDSIIKTEGKVIKNLSNGFYQVLLANGSSIIANVSGKMRKHSIKILVNDIVELEMSIYDASKGRIVRRKKNN